MKFRFIGDPRHGGEGPASVDVGGVEIGRVEFVRVPHAIAAKLAGNNHFESMADSDKPSAPAPRSEPAAANPDKEALIAQAEALGVDVDRRWGVPRLVDEISKAAG